MAHGATRSGKITGWIPERKDRSAQAEERKWVEERGEGRTEEKQDIRAT